MIEFRDITKTFRMGKNQFQALKGINFKIEKGEVVAIVGSSGSGKSTTMYIMGLLDRQTTGHYLLDNEEVRQFSSDKLAALRNKHIGFIFQSFFLLPKLTALQNVALPLVYRGALPSVQKEKALHMLNVVGLADHAHHKPMELSGGQQQRVAIARACVGNPNIMLADEPTGALDSKTSQDVLDFLFEMQQKNQSTLVIITHDMSVANQCRRVIKIMDGVITEDTK